MRPNQTLQVQRILYTMITCLIAAGLKYHYSRAGSGDLLWILEPTALLVEAVSGMGFEYESGAGFVNRMHHIIIAPSCAGVNFMITVFCMAAFLGLKRISRAGRRLVFGGVSIAIAYFAAVTVNTLRIVASFHLYHAGIYSAWLTPERVHRIGGVVVYFLALSVIYFLLLKVLDRPAPATRCRGGSNALRIWHTGAVPASWYLAFAVILPLVHFVYRKWDGRFVEHGLTVGVTCLAVFTLIALIRLSFVVIAAKMGRGGSLRDIRKI